MSEKHKITVYYPNQRFEKNLFQIWKEVLKNVRESKDLIFQLFKRDFTAQYKKSFLGLAWAFITPLFAIASWVLMQLTGVLQPGEVGVPYPIYVLVGSSCWGLLIGIVQGSSSTLTSAASIIQQVKFPHEAVLFKQVLLQLTTFGISFALILIGISFFGVIPKWQSIFLPFALLPILFYGAGVGLFLAMINVVAVDISNFVNKILNFLIYTAPIIYAPTVDNEFLRLINYWNPLTYVVCTMRDLVLYGRVYEWNGLIISTLSGLVLFLIVWKAFYVGEDKLVERMI